MFDRTVAPAHRFVLPITCLIEFRVGAGRVGTPGFYDQPRGESTAIYVLFVALIGHAMGRRAWRVVYAHVFMCVCSQLIKYANYWIIMGVALCVVIQNDVHSDFDSARRHRHTCLCVCEHDDVAPR